MPFLRPIYHNDTVYVRLTCKQKIERDVRGPELPSGIVKWYVEVFDVEDELVAIATILTMVQKKSPFELINRDTIAAYLKKLTEDAKPKWGSASPQRMVEHLEFSLKIASGEIQDFEIVTPENILEKVHDSLYNHRPMPKHYDFPLADRTKNLIYPNLETAKVKLLETYGQFETYFRENPEAATKHVVFGTLNKFEWDLVNTKHLNHHFSQFGLL